MKLELLLLSALTLTLLATVSSRRVTTTLTVNNGGPWGDWHPAEYCPVGSYATGFNLKVEWPIDGDDTALNGIQLRCTWTDRAGTAHVTSHAGSWGVWTGQRDCIRVGSELFVLTSFQLKVESPIDGDDTAANNVKVRCRHTTSSQQYELEGAGGPWGGYGSWSASCPSDSGICGIQTRVENPQGRGDDTALNDVKLFCCND